MNGQYYKTDANSLNSGHFKEQWNTINSGTPLIQPLKGHFNRLIRQRFSKLSYILKFHHRRVKKLTIKLRKLEQATKHKRNDMEFTKNVKPVATVFNSSKQSDINKLAMELTATLTQVDKLIVNLRAQTNNKEVNSCVCVLSASSETRNKGETTLNRILRNAFK